MELLTIKQASIWASNYLNKNITTSNISYLIQYGRITKFEKEGNISVNKSELINYYESFLIQREVNWGKKLGEDLNWKLAFENLKEAETTKHVHRLHPYKGKFIPQLVEYFLNKKIDDFKKQIFFKKDDIVLDPFCGSGTTLVQANELGIHAVGIDVSNFNTFISNVKIQKNNFGDLEKIINKITANLKEFISNNSNREFEKTLTEKLNIYNKKYFPSPEFKIKVRKKEIDEKKYSEKFLVEIENFYLENLKKYKISIETGDENFLSKWYLPPVKKEIDFLFNQIRNVKDSSIKKTLSIILSRTMRSCRATTHADLATLKEPVTKPYYCAKHGKICKPLFSVFSWWQRYSKDTVKRLKQFENLRTESEQICLHGDAQKINILEKLKSKNEKLFNLVSEQKIAGIFSSPPYLGLIDYHEQHAYAYDLFGFERKDHLEIGRLSNGQSKKAQQEYINGIAHTLLNCKRFLKKDYNVFLVANDKFNLYPQIAEKAGMKIVEKFKRPVLNRTEKDRGAYGEIIFHFKENA